MLAILIIILYVAGILWWISKSSTFNIPHLSRLLVGGIFITKILVGILYGYIHQLYFGGGDTFLYFQDSAQIANSFFSYPSYYFQSWLGQAPAIPEGADVFLYPNSSIFWKDLGTYILVHLHALPQLLSFGYYDVHIIFVAIISLIASLNFYKVFSQQLKIDNTILIVACFFMPSVLFWTAGLHKDVWIYLGFSWLLIGLFRYQQKATLKAFRYILIGILTIGLFRYYLLMLLFPTLIGYFWASSNIFKNIVAKYSIVYLLGLSIIIFLEYLGPFSIIDVLSARQAAFIAEGGGSTINNIYNWEPTIWGSIEFLPNAIVNVLFRPFLWECSDFLQFLAGMEITLFLVLLLLSLRLKKGSQTVPSLTYFLLFYALSNLLLIGFLVANVGTIVRYRAIPLGLLAIISIQALHQFRLWRKKAGTSSRSTIQKEQVGKEKIPLV